MPLVPLTNHLLVRRDAKKDRTAGGLHLPDSAQEKQSRGEVLAVGPGKLDDKGQLVPVAIAVGEVVLWPRYSGDELEFEGETLSILREDIILAIVLKE